MPPGAANPRRRVSRKVIAAVVAVVVLAGAGIVVLTRGGDSQRAQQFGPLITPTGDVSGAEPKKAWRATLDDPVQGVSSDGERVFVVAGDEDYELTTFDASGEELWSKRVDGTSLDYIDGMVLSQSATETVAFDPKTGDRLWKSDGTIEARIGNLYIASDSTGDRDTLVVIDRSGDEVWHENGRLSGGCADYLVVTDDDRVLALDADSGEEVWSGKGTDGTCADGLVIVANSDGDLDAISPKDGKERWSAKGLEDPYAVDGTVLASTNDSDDDAEVTALRADNGDELWSEPGFLGAFPVGGNIILTDDEFSRRKVFRLDDGTEVGRSGKDQYLWPADKGFLAWDPDDETLTQFSADMKEGWKISVDGSPVPVYGLIIATDDDRITVYR